MKKISIAFLAAMSLASFGCKKKGAGEAMAKMAEFKDAMCKCTDKTCAEKVQADQAAWSDKMSKNGDKEAAKLSDEDQKKSMAMSDEYGKCMTKAMGGGGAMGGGSDMGGGSAAPPAGSAGSAAAGSAAAPAGGDHAMAGGGDLPAECADYKAMIEKVASCDKLPQASRDAFKQSFDAMSSAWANIPAEGKAQVGASCKQAADTLKQAAGAMCGW